ncbi:MAG: class I SAM-dependent methyltransferase, partial [Mycobacteriales bacterium]
SVLDVGCGGGVAAFAVTPPATSLVGTDRQADMLELFARTAHERGVPVRTVAGSWPEVAPEVPGADVVVCHHVLYNVPDLVPFVAALTAHAARRVVVEISDRHPQVARAPLWQRFWDLDRPAGPAAELAVQVLQDAGVPVRVERFTAPPRGAGHPEVEAAFWCRQLCLPADREPEVAEALAGLPPFVDRVTLWWDA